MTPPDNVSNRTLAGLAAALGIAIGVAPKALLAQQTAATGGASAAAPSGGAPAVAGKTAIMDKASGVLSKDAIQDKSTPLLKSGKVNATWTKGGVTAGNVKTYTPSANQLKSATQLKPNTPVMNTVKHGPLDFAPKSNARVPAVQDKSTPPLYSTQSKALVPAVQDKSSSTLPAIQMKEEVPAVQQKNVTGSGKPQ